MKKGFTLNLKKIILKDGNLLIFCFVAICILSRLNLNSSNKVAVYIDILANLSFQILLGGVLLFLVLLFLKRFIASIIFLFLCLLYMFNIFSNCNNCNAFNKEVLEDHSSIRLMTYNTSFKHTNFMNLKKLINFML